MLHDIVQKGATDRSVTLRIIDSTDGTPETGVVYNTAGIDLWYRREGAAKVSITEATLSALTDAHSDGGVLHIGDGYYRLDLPDAAFASGSNSVDFGGTVTGMVVIGGRVRLVNVNLEDAVRGGLTALPNANAEAAGGLYTRGSGAGQINQSANGQIDANVAAMADAVLTAAKIAADAIGASELAADAVTEIATAIWAAATRTLTANPGLDAAGVRTALGMASGNLDTQIATLATGANLATVAGYLDTEIAAILADTNELQTDWANGGRLDNILDARASQASVDTIDGVVDAILVDTAEIGAAGAGLTVLASAVALATVDTVVDAIQAKTDNLPSDPADQSLVIAATDAVMTRLGAPAGASVSADIAAVKTQTAAIEVDTQDLQAQVGVDGAGLTAVPWNAAWDAEVQSEAADALAAYDGPTKAELDAAVAPLATSAALATVGGNVDLVLEDTGTTLPGTLSAIAGYVDTEVAAIKAKTDLIPAAPAAVGDIPSAAAIADAVHDEVVEGTTTLRQSVRLANAALGGKASGLETTEATFRDLADTKDRIVATVDADGNRTGVTRDLS